MVGMIVVCPRKAKRVHLEAKARSTSEYGCACFSGDPSFLESPIEVTDVDVRGNTLVAVLNQWPREWIKVFRPYSTSVLSSVKQNLRQSLNTLIKNYIQNANNQYVGRLYSLARERQIEEARCSPAGDRRRGEATANTKQVENLEVWFLFDARH